MMDHLRPERWTLAASVLLAVLGTACGLVPYYAVYAIAVAVFDGRLTFDLTVLWAAAVTAAVAAKAAMMMASTYLAHVAAFGILHNLRTLLVEKFSRMPLGFFTRHPAGTLKKTVADDVEQIEEAIAHAIPDISAGLAVPLLSALVLATVDWRLAVVSLVMLPLLLAMYGLMLKATQPHSAGHFAALARLKSLAIDYVQGMKVIRAFLRADVHYRELGDAIDTVARAGERFGRSSLVPMSVVYAGLRGNILVLLPVGGLLFLDGSISAAVFALFLIMGMGMNASALKVLFAGGTFFWRFKMAAGAIETILKAEELPATDVPQTPSGAAIRFESVTFAYENQTVLDDVSFTAEEGTVTAIVGPSGSGKTTMARLIPRFWDVGAGRITLGGVDIRDMTPDALMQSMSLVLQDPWLFTDTIRANIRAGRLDASDAEVEGAAARARVTDFAAAFPDGLDTPVGEGGRQLSGGQRQRVAIARAMLRAAPVVVLDEATAALDPENESLVLDALKALAAGRTVVAIAHRLDTIRDADQILYVEAGRIIARGQHATLLETCPGYARLWAGYQAVAAWQLPTDTAAEPPTLPATRDPSPEGVAAEPAGKPEGSLSQLKPVSLFLALAGPMRSLLLGRAMPLLFAEGVCTGFPVFVVFLALQDAFAGTLSEAALWTYSAVILACLILQAMINVAANRTLWRIQTGAVAALQRRIAAHLRLVPMGEITTRDTGVLEAAITQHAAEQNFVVPPAQALKVLVGPAIASTVLMLVDWRLALATIATLPVFVVTVAWGDRRYREVWRDLVASVEVLGSRLLDAIQGMATIRSLGLGGARFTALSQALAQHRQFCVASIGRLVGGVGVGLSVLDAAFALIVLIGGLLLLQGGIAPDRFLLFLVIGMVFFGPIADAFDLVAYARLMERSMRRVGAILDIPPLAETTTPEQPRSLDISFENVSFSYGDKPALRDVSFTLEGGRTHALVGPSGSGKSTALNLIARFWDVDAGSIRLGGADLRHIPTVDRERLVSIVFQDTFLFNDTIAGNLRLARPDASDADLVAVAKAARCHDFIMAMPDGYQTLVGDSGSRLSGGERQRIAIARAMLKDAPILLLDEATASLDPDNEHEVRAALAEACRGKTVVVIAHRPNTIASADRVVVFDSGRVIDTVSGFADFETLQASFGRQTPVAAA